MKWFDIADELLPPVYKAIKDMYAYARTLDTELRQFLLYSKAILNNFFIQTCDVKTIEYWESLLGIVLYGDETIDERRENIFLYLNNNTPITEPTLRNTLDTLFGNDAYKLWIDVENGHPYDLHLILYTASYDAIKRFIPWFNRMCPAHLCLLPEHVEQAETHFANYLHAESDVLSTATITLTSGGTATLYYGNSSQTVDMMEIG